MKKIIVFLLLFSVITAKAQNENYIEKGYYKTAFLMPDGSIQYIYLFATTEGEKEFFRVAYENMLQTSKISLRQKVLSNKTVHLRSTPSISERSAYRFLANNLCETCKDGLLNKENTVVMVLNAPSGKKNMLEIFWLEDKGWVINLIMEDEAVTGKITLDKEFVAVLIY